MKKSTTENCGGGNNTETRQEFSGEAISREQFLLTITTLTSLGSLSVMGEESELQKQYPQLFKAIENYNKQLADSVRLKKNLDRMVKEYNQNNPQQRIIQLQSPTPETLKLSLDDLYAKFYAEHSPQESSRSSESLNSLGNIEQTIQLKIEEQYKDLCHKIAELYFNGAAEITQKEFLADPRIQQKLTNARTINQQTLDQSLTPGTTYENKQDLRIGLFTQRGQIGVIINLCDQTDADPIPGRFPRMRSSVYLQQTWGLCPSGQINRLKPLEHNQMQQGESQPPQQAENIFTSDTKFLIGKRQKEYSELTLSEKITELEATMQYIESYTGIKVIDLAKEKVQDKAKEHPEIKHDVIKENLYRRTLISGKMYKAWNELKPIEQDQLTNYLETEENLALFRSNNHTAENAATVQQMTENNNNNNKEALKNFRALLNR